LCAVVDGGYAKEPFLKPAVATGTTVISRLRKDAAQYDLPRALRHGEHRAPGRPRKYGKNRISLAKRAAHWQGWQTIHCAIRGKPTTKITKTLLATCRPVGRDIRVVIVKEEHHWFALFSTDPGASAVDIVEAAPDRSTIERNSTT